MLLLLAVLIAVLIAALGVRWLFRANPKVQGMLEMERLRTEDRKSVRLRRGRSTFSFGSSDGRPAGQGRVQPTRTGNGATALVISYTPDGDPDRRSVETLHMPDGTVTLGSVRFTFAVEVGPEALPRRSR